MKFFLFFLFAVGILACNIPKHQGAALNLEDAAKQLQNKRWVLNKLADTTFEKPEKEIYIQFEDNGGRLRGFAGCNNITGTYLLTRTLKINDIISTKMWCPMGPIENKLINALEKTDNFVVNGDNLQLIRNDKTPLAYFTAVYLEKH